MNLRDQILSKSAFPTKSVSIPDWGDGLAVRMMTAAERDAFESGTVANGETNLTNFRARLVVRCLVGPDGKRIFADADAEALGAARADLVGIAYDAAAELNGMSGTAVEAAAGN